MMKQSPGDHAPMTRDDILAFALEREREAREMYEVFARRDGGGGVVTLRGERAGEEAKHEAGFRRILASLEMSDK